MVKTQFGIKDLENLSNVKAHTIRIWEKRYNLLEPDRTDTNIRKYDIENLKKLLNIAYLYNAGYKISALAKLKPDEIQWHIKDSLNNSNSNYAINIFKSAMLDFNDDLFDATLKNLTEQKTFREIFTQIFVPLLSEIGVLWHMDSIDISHEHFISEKIKHAIINRFKTIEKKQQSDSLPTFTLFLPKDEIHEIGLLYANYELLDAGYSTLYLGPNMEMESLKYVLKTRKENIFITYFTIQPESESIEKYIHDFQDKMGNSQLWVLGRKNIPTIRPNRKLLIFNELDDFISKITNLKTG